jgi:tRNA pseudouridine55 synthase
VTATPHGILVVDKPSGPTSHDVVAQARRVFGTRRVGHAGTLDPMATGVLVLLLGEATKLSDVATNERKTYLAEVRFGRATHSLDAQGQTTAEKVLEPGWLQQPRLEHALELERARVLQLPPAVSAIKLDGQRAYRLAHAGKPPELAPRAIAVYALSLLDYDAESARLELSVSKGYYVRALARDLGDALGVPAHLSSLRRVQSGCFGLDEACVWPAPCLPALIPLAQAVPRLAPTRRLTDAGVARARQGRALSATDFMDGEAAHEPSELDPSITVAWTDAAGTPVALGRREGDIFRVQRGFTADAALATDCSKA